MRCIARVTPIAMWKRQHPKKQHFPRLPSRSVVAVTRVTHTRRKLQCRRKSPTTSGRVRSGRPNRLAANYVTVSVLPDLLPSACTTQTDVIASLPCFHVLSTAGHNEPHYTFQLYLLAPHQLHRSQPWSLPRWNRFNQEIVCPTLRTSRPAMVCSEPTTRLRRYRTRYSTVQCHTLGLARRAELLGRFPFSRFPCTERNRSFLDVLRIGARLIGRPFTWSSITE